MTRPLPLFTHRDVHLVTGEQGAHGLMLREFRWVHRVRPLICVLEPHPERGRQLAFLTVWDAIASIETRDGAA